MKPETESLMNLADVYADAWPAADRKWGKPRHDLESAIDSLVSDRDTLAAGVRELVGCSAVRLDGIHVIQAAIAVAVRLKAASEPAKPPAVPDATTEPEYDLVEVHPDGRAWRYRPGEDIGECTSHFPGNWKPTVVYGRCRKDTGAVRFPSMPAALAWWRETHPEPAIVVGHATGGPKSAEHAGPTQPTGKMTLADRIAEMRHEVDGILKRGGSSHTTEIINAIHVTARVVDELAKVKETKP